MMKKNKKNENRKLVFGAMLVAMFMVGTALSFIVTIDVYKYPQPTGLLNQDFEKEEKENRKILLPMTAANNSPGSYGVVNIFTVDDGTIGNGYNGSIVESDTFVWEHADAGGFADDEVAAPHEELANTTAYENEFGIVIVYQFTGAQCVDGGTWNTSRALAYMNSTGLSISSAKMNVGSSFYQTTGTGDSDTGRINFYIRDTDGQGAGTTKLSLSIDETFIASAEIYYIG